MGTNTETHPPLWTLRKHFCSYIVPVEGVPPRTGPLRNFLTDSKGPHWDPLGGWGEGSPHSLSLFSAHTDYRRTDVAIHTGAEAASRGPMRALFSSNFANSRCWSTGIELRRRWGNDRIVIRLGGRRVCWTPTVIVRVRGEKYSTVSSRERVDKFSARKESKIHLSHILPAGGAAPVTIEYNR